VVRFGALAPTTEPVLDLACGRGRHTRWFLQRGYRVVAVDRDLTGIADLSDEPRLEAVEADLEASAPAHRGGPVGTAPEVLARRYGAVVVTNYLYRPILDPLVTALVPGGLFVYETFARGHERLGRPTNPDFLLEPGELLRLVRGRLRVLAFEDVTVDEPRPALVQRIAAMRAT
jgi:SAM-dependent methyltransferase